MRRLMNTIKGLLAIVAAGCLFAGACGGELRPPPESVPPLSVVFIQDSLGSGSPLELRLSVDGIKHFIDYVLSVRGGEVAVIVVTDDAEPPVLRLSVAALTDCTNSRTDFDAADCARANKVTASQAAENVTVFLRDLGGLLARASTADRELWPAVRRGGLFLSEPSVGSTAPTEKSLVLITSRDSRHESCLDVYGERTAPERTVIHDSFGGSFTCCAGEWYRTQALDAGQPCDVQPSAPAPGPQLMVNSIPAKTHLAIVKASTALTPLSDFPHEEFGSVDKAMEFIAQVP